MRRAGPPVAGGRPWGRAGGDLEVDNRLRDLMLALPLPATDAEGAADAMGTRLHGFPREGERDKFVRAAGLAAALRIAEYRAGHMVATERGQEQLERVLPYVVRSSCGATAYVGPERRGGAAVYCYRCGGLL